MQNFVIEEKGNHDFLLFQSAINIKVLVGFFGFLNINDFHRHECKFINFVLLYILDGKVSRNKDIFFDIRFPSREM